MARTKRADGTADHEGFVSTLWGDRCPLRADPGAVSPACPTSTPLDLPGLWLAIRDLQHLQAGRIKATEPAVDQPIVCPEKETGPGTLAMPSPVVNRFEIRP